MLFAKKNAERMVAKTILPVQTIEAATSFYQAAGFSVEQFSAEYAIVMHQGQELLHLAKAERLNPATNAAAIYLHVTSADDWHTRWSDAGLDVSPVVDEPHGMREFHVRDPDGNLIRLGHNL